ncbi:acetylornithine deacetylase [Rhodobium orientis]|nr:acetylornithine deacetylase [Rhodobium orientis]MBB4304459.1 acetylornithine deacetylase [Rhodobium orientis]
MMTEMTPREMLAKLVGFATVSRDSNRALIDFVAGYLAHLGIEARIVPNADGSKANLYATIGPNVAGGVVLSGHTDVVPVDGQHWSSDPFTLTERDEKLFGRGTCDMKGFLAIALSLVPEMKRAGLSRPIHLALSYDEEIGCLGAPEMIAEMAAELPPSVAVIVGEPSSMKVITGHKSILVFTTTVTGHSVHSSQIPRGVSATMVAARLVAYLEDMMEEGKGTAAENPAYDPPFTTIHVGLLNGGTASNIVARECRFVTDIRALPEEDPEAYLQRFEAHVRKTVVPAMRAVAPETGIDIEVRSVVPGLRPEPENEAERLARMLTGDNEVRGAAFCAEAGQFQQAGFATVICGPGSIDQAHQPDEFLSLDQLQAGTEFVRRLIGHLT